MTTLGEKAAAEAPVSSRKRTAIDRRNLRRTDWRVLLPVPQDGFDHLVLAGGPEKLPDAIIETGIARRVSTALPSEPSADAAVILHDGRFGCEEVRSALLPGASLYWEVQTALAPSGAARSLRARLGKSGLTLTGLYWVRPDFDRCDQFIPIDFPEALRWYLSNWTERSPWRRLFVSGPRTRWAASFLSLMLRRCAVTAVAGDRETSPSILEHGVVRREIGPARARTLVVNRGGTDASRRVILFPFQAGSEEPRAVLKFSRLPERNAEVEEEQKIVADVRARLDFRLRKTIPAPLGTFRWGHVAVGVESYARGLPLSSHAPRPRRVRREDLRLVTRWLRDFHLQSQIRRGGLASTDVDGLIAGPLASYARAFGATEKEALLFACTRDRMQSLLGRPFPIVWTHTAFSEWNVCRSRSEVSVIDWEAAEPGLPLRDLIYFVTVWYFRSQRQSGQSAQISSFDRLFFARRPDPMAEDARSALADYMKSLSIDREFFPPMLVMTWVIRALGRLKRVRAYGEPGEDPRKSNLHVGFLSVLADSRERLFEEAAP